MDNQGRFDRLDDKLDALADKWDNRLNQIDEKWDEKFGDIYKMLHEHSLMLKEHGLIHDINSKNIEVHILRTQLLEDKLEKDVTTIHEKYEPLKEKHESMIFLLKAISWVAGLVGSIWLVVEQYFLKK